MLLEFEFVALVASQKNKLPSWIEKWEVLDDKLAEIYIVAEKRSGILITKELFLCRFKWYAKHIFSLPIHIYALAEKQINIARPQYVRVI